MLPAKFSLRKASLSYGRQIISYIPSRCSFKTLKRNYLEETFSFLNGGEIYERTKETNYFVLFWMSGG